MRRFEVGDRVRVDIPDETDPDFDRFHGRFGKIVGFLSDDADEYSGDSRDSTLYQVNLEGGETATFRWRDLRPVSE